MAESERSRSLHAAHQPPAPPQPSFYPTTWFCLLTAPLGAVGAGGSIPRPLVGLSPVVLSPTAPRDPAGLTPQPPAAGLGHGGAAWGLALTSCTPCALPAEPSVSPKRDLFVFKNQTSQNTPPKKSTWPLFSATTEPVSAGAVSPPGTAGAREPRSLPALRSG